MLMLYVTHATHVCYTCYTSIFSDNDKNEACFPLPQRNDKLIVETDYRKYNINQLTGLK